MSVSLFTIDMLDFTVYSICGFCAQTITHLGNMQGLDKLF